MASGEVLRRSVKGLSEAEFRERFGTEEACRAALFEMRWHEGLACRACGGRGFCELRARKVFQCNRCKRQVSLTAGTVFQDTKLPLATWFAAIYHLAQGKNGISSVELGRRLGVKQATAWLMKHKLMRAMAGREAGKPKLAGRVEIDDAYLGGERPGGRRGGGAAGGGGSARGAGRDRRRLPRRRAPGRQARPRGGRQDADRGRGRDQRRQEAEAAAPERGQGVPQEGGREAGQAGPRRRRHRGQPGPRRRPRGG